ncbi:MAG: 2-amino-4-hydroxy-6-hydroxymethyldihydropteridine diphosphokinase [Wenzhouxiangella sp.]
MSRAWVGLGANLGRPKETLQQALAALDGLPATILKAVSPSYWTPAWGGLEQPEFLNAVACLETGQAPLELLRALLAIESGLGRIRSGPRWGPRAIDLDLLLFDQRELQTAELTLPHPRLHQRAFVLVPLADLAPEQIVPGKGKVSDLLEALDSEQFDGIRPAGALECG